MSEIEEKDNNTKKYQSSDIEYDDIKPIANQIIQKIETENPQLLEGITNKEALAETFLTVFTQEVEVRHEYEEHTEHHQGPLPAPSTLQGYNNVIENGAERIMTVFENQASHRMSLENKVVGRQTFQSLFGQILGFLIALTCLVLGVILVMKGFNTAGITLFSLDIVGLAYVFVVGRKHQEKSLNQKR